MPATPFSNFLKSVPASFINVFQTSPPTQPTHLCDRPSHLHVRPTRLGNQPAYTTNLSWQPTRLHDQPVFATDQPVFTSDQPVLATNRPIYSMRPTSATGTSSQPANTSPRPTHMSSRQPNTSSLGLCPPARLIHSVGGWPCGDIGLPLFNQHCPINFTCPIDDIYHLTDIISQIYLSIYLSMLSLSVIIICVHFLFASFPFRIHTRQNQSLRCFLPGPLPRLWRVPRLTSGPSTVFLLLLLLLYWLLGRNLHERGDSCSSKHQTWLSKRCKLNTTPGQTPQLSRVDPQDVLSHPGPTAQQ